MSAFTNTFFNWSQIKGVMPSLLEQGLPNTLLISVLALILGLGLGLLLAVLLISPHWWVRLPARTRRRCGVPRRR